MSELLINPYRLGGAAPPAFNPLTQVTALHAMWAGDPSWSNPGDGNPVDSWRNQYNADTPASTGTNRPTYRASVATLGNKPAIEFVAANSQRLHVALTSVISSPRKWVIVFKQNGVAGNPMIAGDGGNTSRGFRQIASGPNYRVNFGTNLNGGTATTSPHVARITGNNMTSQFWIDEVSAASGDAGASTHVALAVGVGANLTPTFSDFFDGYIAFYGVYDHATTSDASLTALANDLRTHYGF